MRRLLSLIAVATSVLIGPPAAAATCDGAFRPVEHPAAQGADLRGVTMLSRSDAWAVGVRFDSVGHAVPLAEHWDGSAWTDSPAAAPSGGSVGTSLNDVSGTGTGDVWAVGTTTNKIFIDKTFIEHWDGQAWSIVQSPSPNANGVLNATVAISPTDAWAGGTYLPSGDAPLALLLHWNGRKWSAVSAPRLGVETVAGMSATGTDDVWAVGRIDAEGGYYRPLVKHWDGTAWTNVKVPQLGSQGGWLQDVTAIAPDDAWAVGIRGIRNVALHWDGVSWMVVKTVQPAQLSDLSGVDATGPDDVWAVGASYEEGTAVLPLVEHWDGVSWSTVPAGVVSSSDNRLEEVAATGRLRWAVGNALKGRNDLATIQRSCGAY
jgi:hypothetical protein